MCVCELNATYCIYNVSFCLGLWHAAVKPCPGTYKTIHVLSAGGNWQHKSFLSCLMLCIETFRSYVMLSLNEWNKPYNKRNVVNLIK